MLEVRVPFTVTLHVLSERVVQSQPMFTVCAKD